MSKLRFAAFLSTALAIYGLLNLYIYEHGLEICRGDHCKTPYLAVFLVLSVLYIGGRFLERIWLSWVSSALVWLGSFWLAAMVYFLLASVVVDIVRLLGVFLPILPANVPAATIGIVVVACVFALVAGGYVNALRPRITSMSLTVSQNGSRMKSLTIAVASDIHLGTIVCKARLERIVGKINALAPDLVLLPGDVVDEDLGPVVKQNLGETLRKIRSRYGVIAITGNHEYIGGVEAASRYLSEHGITVLRDSSIILDGSIRVVGREDRSIGQFSRRKRKSLQELLASVDSKGPVILLDHQPFGLEEAERNQVDVQLSGHTHHGQLWPFNLITSRIYEVSWGYKQKGRTHVYVSSGVGTWGPPVRIGNHPEIVHITLTLDDGHQA